MSTHSPPPLVVGFDLDMTLFNTAPALEANLRATAAGLGIDFDVARFMRELGPPLHEMVAEQLPAEQAERFTAYYREHYRRNGLPAAELLPGAVESLAAVRRQHGRAIVITGKNDADARRHIEHDGLDVDAVIGWAWGPTKTAAMLEHGASVYVGDHPADVAAAKAAEATAVAVTTGSHGSDAFADADAVLPSLTEFPRWLDSHLTGLRRRALLRRLADCRSLLVAFSGGADSALLLAAAVRALGAANVVAATAVSPSLPEPELAAARDFAAELGVAHLTPATAELDRDGYRANNGDRCYFCKTELMTTILPLAAEHGIAAVATGTNADDLVAGFRPGIRAAAEHGALTPLADVGLTKPQVRAISREWSLPTWDKPAAACLSSRIAYGVPVTGAGLSRVAHAEQALRLALADAGLPVRDLRVRDLGDDVARVEIDAELVAAVAGRPELLAAVPGFDTVELDPRGYRTGAMNELLPDPRRYR